MTRDKKVWMVALALFGAAGRVMAADGGSVQIFGILDTGISYYSNQGGPSNWAASSSNITSSRFGFRGKEDLGGGLSAFFHLEGPISVNSPEAASFNRKSVLGLDDREKGKITLGRNYTPLYDNTSDFGGPWVTNGVGDGLGYEGTSIMYKGAGFSGRNVRSSNSVSYETPDTLGGAFAKVMYGFEDPDVSAAGQKTGRFVSARVGYERGNLNAGLAVGRLQGPNQSAYNAGDVTAFNIGAIYGFSFAKVSAIYDYVESALSVGTARMNAMTVGVIVPVGAHEFRVGWSWLAYDPVVSKKLYPGQAHVNKWAFGYVYYLSKRTSLYTTYAYLNNNGRAAINTGSSVAVAAGKSSQGLDFGIRHTF